MRADPEDQLHLEGQRNRTSAMKWPLAAIVLAGFLLYWFWQDQEQEQETATTISAPAVDSATHQQEVPPAPDIPRRPEPAVEMVSEVEMNVEPSAQVNTVTPSFQDGESLLRMQLKATGVDENLFTLVNDEHPLEVSAALIDSMSRGVILRKLLPVKPLGKIFPVTVDSDIVYMNATGFARYDTYANSIASLDGAMLVDAFHALRPFYERVYENLGLDAGDFDNAVVRTLDLILATPVIEDPIALEHTSVMYTYADPKLEGLSALQKQLLRMGPENVRRIRRQAQWIRDALLGQ